ncbi:MAG: DMT family transporter [Desulfobulbaceae bacterium]|nr:DMT family transporter [Desulfobulbaceae bacterium]
MLLAAILVSSSFIVGKAITHGLDPAILTLIRFGLATLFFAPVLAAKKLLFLPPVRQLLGYSTISATTVLFFWCMFESLRYTSAVNTSVIFTLTPGISGIYSALFLKELLGRNRIWALLFGMTGALWVIFQGDLNRLLAMDINHGDLLFLLGCFLMAAYTPLVKKFHRQESMLVMTFWVLCTGVGWLLLLSYPKLATIDWQGIEFRIWAGILYLAFFSTIVTFYLTHLATPYLGPTRVMAYSYFYPSFVLAINWILGNGLPPLATLPGILVVSLSIIVLQRGQARFANDQNTP